MTNYFSRIVILAIVLGLFASVVLITGCSNNSNRSNVPSLDKSSDNPKIETNGKPAVIMFTAEW